MTNAFTVETWVNPVGSAKKDNEPKVLVSKYLEYELALESRKILWKITTDDFDDGW